MIVIEVDGVQYGNFISANVQQRLDALSNTFSFDATSETGTPFPFEGGQACRVFAEEELVLTGNIELVSASYDTTSHKVTFEGRDKTGDLLDSSLSAMPDLKTPTLAKLCKRVLANIGLNIKVIDLVNAAPFDPAKDIESPDPGEGAFAFLEKYTRKRQVLMSSTVDGDLLLTASSGETIDALVSNLKGNPNNDNNVVRADVSYDSTGRYNVYRVVSQLNTSAGTLAGVFKPSSVASQGAQVVRDEAIRAGRQLILVSEATASGPEAVDRATWQANIEKARGRVYSPELRGFRDQSGDLWRINTLPQVTDEAAGINDRMLVNSVSFSNSLAAGSEKTVLGFVEKDAYTLQLEEPVEEKTGSTGAGIFG